MLINEDSVQKFLLPEYTFVRETQSLGNPHAWQVPHGTAQFHSVDIEGIETILQHGTHRTSDDSFALKFFTNKIADLGEVP
nr:hypothetical protein [Janthinobacterium sp.]